MDDDDDPPIIQKARVRRVPSSDTGASGYGARTDQLPWHHGLAKSEACAWDDWGQELSKCGRPCSWWFLTSACGLAWHGAGAGAGEGRQGQSPGSRAVRPSPPPASLQSRIAVPPNIPQQDALESERDEQQQRSSQQGLVSGAPRRATGKRDPAALQGERQAGLLPCLHANPCPSSHPHQSRLSRELPFRPSLPPPLSPQALNGVLHFHDHRITACNRHNYGFLTISLNTSPALPSP